MSDNAIRVQLPGGAAYAPAMREAAIKTGERTGLPTGKTKSLTALVEAAVDLLNNASAVSITLQMTVDDDAISVAVTGRGCSKPEEKSAAKFDRLASKNASEFSTRSTKSAYTINFVV